MKTAKNFLAVDLGASSGRLIAGRFDGEHLELEELYRFENAPVDMNGTLYWDLPGLWQHIQNGLLIAGTKYSGNIAGIGVDTWGVDFAFLDRDGRILSNPVCYRDSRTDGVMEQAFQTVPRNEIFQHTGLQFLQFNTLYQLLAMKQSNSPLFDAAETFLMMPDIFHYLLSGEKSNEFTNATTTQMFNPVQNGWAFPLLDKLGIPSKFLGKVSPPGTLLGTLRKELGEAAGLPDTRVILPGSHDTASAVMSVPAQSNSTPAHSVQSGGPDWAYISLGTWALMGIESPKPLVNETVSALNFTNEGGVGKTMRVLKNISGLWLLQECRRVWNTERRHQQLEPYSWEDMSRMTQQAAPQVSFIDPDAREFLGPTDMPKAIADYCRRTGQRVPETQGEILRCALDSIALKFRQVLEMCEQVGGRKIDTIHIVGGGTKNRQLCKAAADICQRRVLTGPVEATAIGNIMMQAIALGEVKDVAEARQIVRSSFDIIEFTPENDN
ncbi:MAG: rhamnulokinase [Planctomycetaceae bacterium]|jgi:rhamnulokinase|nr:rhamnulokinase [Planctomycetaceae bacterium]